MRDVATALAAVLVAFMFIGCASAPERRETAFTAATPVVAGPASGACDVRPGTTSAGRSCLRLRIPPPGGACVIGDRGLHVVCNRLDLTLLESGIHTRTADCRVFRYGDDVSRSGNDLYDSHAITCTPGTGALSEPAAPANSCRHSGGTTMVRGGCTFNWDGGTVQISGTCDVTPGADSRGPFLRLQTKAVPGDCAVNPGPVLLQCRNLDVVLRLKNGAFEPESISAAMAAATSSRCSQISLVSTG